MTLDEFINNHYEDGEVYSDVEGITFKQVHSEEEHNHKTVTYTEVFNLVGTDEYFEVSTDRDDVGYWGDAEWYDPEFRKVIPKKEIVEITKWVDV